MAEQVWYTKARLKMLTRRRKMSAIRGVVKNARVEVDAPPDWPDGAPVRVELGLNGQADDDERPETASWMTNPWPMPARAN
jgi:hypothetical protein